MGLQSCQARDRPKPGGKLAPNASTPGSVRSQSVATILTDVAATLLTSGSGELAATFSSAEAFLVCGDHRQLSRGQPEGPRPLAGMRSGDAAVGTERPSRAERAVRPKRAVGPERAVATEGAVGSGGTAGPKVAARARAVVPPARTEGPVGAERAVRAEGAIGAKRPVRAERPVGAERAIRIDAAPRLHSAEHVARSAVRMPWRSRGWSRAVAVRRRLRLTAAGRTLLGSAARP